MDVWNHIVEFSTDGTLAVLYNVSVQHRGVALRVIRSRLHRHRECTFTHQTKDMFDRYGYKTSSMCVLCYTYAMTRFYASYHHIPKLRCDGGEFNWTVQQFNRDPHAQLMWFCSDAYHHLSRVLPRTFSCTYYPKEDQDPVFLRHLEAMA